VAVADGGFDPVEMVGAVGDQIAITVQTTSAPIAYALLVPAARPPVVVRTDPPPNKRDVALGTPIEIVFSQPIDAASLTEGSIQLTAGGVPVPGELAFADGAHVTVEFVPDVPLAGGTEYTLVVAPTVRDVNGVPVATSVTLTFTTVVSYDGTWVGTTSDGLPISFTVAASAVNDLHIGFNLHSPSGGSCAVGGINLTILGPAAQITGASLNGGAAGSVLSITGTFLSSTDASGSATADPYAGDICLGASTWTAHKQ
jgi:hypothetical protein